MNVIETADHPGNAEVRFRFTPTEFVFADGTRAQIRIITPEDEPRMIEFHRTLSAESIHARYFGTLSFGFRTGHNRLAAICAPDLSREIALVAEHEFGAGKDEILGVGRLSKTPGIDEVEFAVLVSDLWQGEGLGSFLFEALVEIARAAGMRIIGHILAGNGAMLHAVREAGFELRFLPADGEWKAELDLRPAAAIVRVDRTAA